MSDSAKKSAAELAAELVNDSITIVTPDVAQPLEGNTEIAVGKLAEPTLQLHYDIIVDSITGSSPNVHEQNISVLKGRVTEDDLRQAGVDINWLIRVGSIVEAGYHRV